MAPRLSNPGPGRTRPIALGVVVVAAVAAITTVAQGWFAPGSVPDPSRARDLASGQGPRSAAEDPMHADPSADRPPIARTEPTARSRPDADPAGPSATRASGPSWRPTDAASPTLAAWPVARSAVAGTTGGTAAATAGEPTVPTRIAFRALWYLGTDPEAERTWLRAINDLAHPPGVRSDLIIDMIDEGYSDNSHPTKADLPVIRARLELIERYAPYAVDEVNAEAFEIAYRYLLDMYVRLGGEPRGEPR